MKSKKFIDLFLSEQQNSLSKIIENTTNILEICEKLISIRNKNKQIFVIGNGGSASTASHFVSDLLKTALIKNSKKFKAISLSDNIPVLTAWANDVSYDDIYVEQLKNYFSKGDLIIAFSGSGNSKNIVKTLEFGKKNGAFCIGITGKNGGKMKKFTNLCLQVPSDDMLAIESLHVVVCHCIISTIRNLGKPIFEYK